MHSGNDLRVLAAGASGTVDRLETLRVRGSDLDPFYVNLGEAFDNAPPPPICDTARMIELVTIGTMMSLSPWMNMSPIRL